MPNPSLSDSNLSNPSLPGIDVESSEGGGNEDGTSNGEDKGWIDSLTDFAQSVGNKLDSFTQNAIDTLGDIGSSILDGLAEAGQWIADNWEFTAAVVAGVGLTIAGIFVAPLLPFGLAILAGIAISGGIGYFTGLRGEDLTKEMGIGGALGAIGGGVLGIVGKVAGTGLKTLVTGSALSGAITSMADDILHNRKPSIPKAVIGVVLGVGLTAKQKKLIKEAAEKNKYIPKINVIKVEGMKFGFADFESAGVVKGIVYLPENMWKLTDVEQFKYLDEVIGGSQPGMTWHHSEVPGKMQLIPTGIHNITTHNGGRTEGMWADAPRK